MKKDSLKETLMPLITLENVQIKTETQKGNVNHGALLVNYEGATVWLPKSQIEDWPEVGDSGDVILPEWLAIEKGLI